MNTNLYNKKRVIYNKTKKKITNNLQPLIKTNPYHNQNTINFSLNPTHGDNDHLIYKLYQNWAINIKYLTSDEVTTKSLETN